MGLPADASGAYRPNPQATTKLAPRPSSLKGYIGRGFLLTIEDVTPYPPFGFLHHAIYAMIRFREDANMEVIL
jgi:hypothetical protein